MDGLSAMSTEDSSRGSVTIAAWGWRRVRVQGRRQLTAGSESEHQPERGVDLSQLVVGQVSGGGAEPFGVDRCSLLSEHPRVDAAGTSISGRKLAARADVDVGATSQVDSGS